MNWSRTSVATARPRRARPWAEIVVVALVFAAFCAVVLAKGAQMLEPDDYAYRASIVALTHGHLLLTTAQYNALNAQLAATGGQGIAQWTHLSSGLWISEKNPGYPFFAVVFYLLGILRITPLFYGALACAGLFCGARRWLGRWGGVWAVVLYCSSGAALVFAWRSSMPSFSDASLIAAGAGCLLWTMLARDATTRRRLIVGLLGFLAIEGAVFMRYTNVVELAVAVIAIVVLHRLAAVPRRTLLVWLASVVLFSVGLLTFNRLVYGSALSTGYSSGEITFAFSAILPNLKSMPGQLLRAMPMLVLGLAAAAWIGARLLFGGRRTRHAAADAYSAGGGASLAAGALPRAAGARRDALVAAVLLAGWLGLWALYAAYTWTEQMGNGGAGQTVHVVRFYLPVIGLIALLGAWLLARLPRRLPPAVLVAVAVLGVLSFQSMATQGVGGGGGGQPGRFAAPGGSSLPPASGGAQPAAAGGQSTN